MLVAVLVPMPTATTKGVFLKLRERQAFDFAVMSVAVAVKLQMGKVADSRVVFGGMAPVPLRSAKAEAALKGKSLKDAVAVACAAAVEGTQPLSGNGYKVAVAKGVLGQALTHLA
jgi:xanthine dehydrogenase YagS FAD-binding subunit